MLTPVWQEKAGIYFSYEDAVQACAFMETLHHIEGPKAGDHLELDPYQMWIECGIHGFRYQGDGIRVVNTVYAELPRKHGKAEDIENYLPTPQGMRQMRDLQPGDFVFAADGSPTRVVAVTEPQLNRPCMEVEFASGEKIVVDENHEWLTEPRRMGPRALDRKQPRDLWWNAAETARVFETKEIAETLTCGGREDNNHFVPVAAPLQMPEAVLPIAPYVLGAWLGDGSSRTSQITCDDQGILDRIEAEGESVKKLTGRYLYAIGERQRKDRAKTFGARLTAMNLTLSKHVPEAYMLASEAQRRALLQGLMDTDGSALVATNGLARCEFTTTSPRLRSDVKRLVASLGMKPTVLEGRASLNGVDCGPKWRICFTAYREDAVFGLERKLNRLSPRPAKRTRAGTRAIVAVRRVENRTTKCIQIEHPSHVYLTGFTCIPTHNSLIAGGNAWYMTTVDAGRGDHCYIIAPKFDQGLKVLNPMREMAKENAALTQHFSIKCTAKAGRVEKTKSDIVVLASLGEKEDGHNPAIVVADEFHALGPEIYKVMKSAQRARDQSMFWQMGSAGRKTYGPGWDERRFAIDVLEGKAEADHLFVVIYTVDPGDELEWYSERVIRKANPGVGSSINLRKTVQEAQEARRDPLKKVEFLRTALNLWGFSEQQLFPKEKWDRCARRGLTLESMKGLRGYTALDLASRDDMVALGVIFEEPTGEVEMINDLLVQAVDLYAFAWHFVPDKGAWIGDEDLIGPYTDWKDKGRLTFSPGSQHDYKHVRRQLFWLNDNFDIAMNVIDDHQANETYNACMARKLPVQSFRKNAPNFSDPTKDLMARINGEIMTFFHDDNPVLGWNFQNAIGGPDTRDLILPKKPSPNSNQKIDGLDCMVMANAARLQMAAELPAKKSASVVKGLRRT